MANNELHLSFESIRVCHAKKELLHGSSQEVRAGQIVWIRGENGSGKSTLLRVLAAWQLPQSGHVKRGNNPVRRPILVPANPESMLFPWYRVSRNLDLFADLAISRVHPEDQKGRLDITNAVKVLHLALIKQFGLKELLDRHPYNLSSGEAAKLAVACGLLAFPTTLMLDELFNSIDVNTTQVVADFLAEECNQRRISLLIVSHQDGPLVRLAQTEWLLEPGVALMSRHRA